MIRATGLTKTFGGSIHALRDVSLAVEPGTIFGVVGQSGAGKSTLLRAINLLERPDTGTVQVDGTDMTALSGAELRRARRRIGMVFQHFNLLSNRTVQQNVEFAMEAVGVHGAERSRRAAEMLDLVGLSGREGHYPAQLSGGQKQRVGIARALAGRPKVLLSDEATSALDPETTRSVLDLIKRLNAELDLTVLLITHEMDVVKRICDSAALMEYGRLVEHGKLVEVISRPGSRLAAELFPLGPVPPDDGRSVVDVTFSDGSADRPVIAQLARKFEMDVSILGATIETIDGHQAGRTRLALPGGPELVAGAIAELHAHGLIVDVVRRGGAA